MEQNKVLMVIVSVVIFFAAIVGVGMALLYPRGDETAQASSGQVVREFDPIEYVRRPDRGEMEESDEDEDSDEVVIVYGDLPEQTEADEDSEERTVFEERTGDGPSEVTITERPARSSDRTEDSGEEEEPSRSTPEDTPEVADSQQEQSSTSSERDSQQQDSAQRDEAAPEPRQIRVTEYWIQLISSPNRDRVDQARATLTDYSLGGRVTTRDVEGDLFYRLRVGPYDSHGEAEKFLEWIRDIDGFGEAYISEEYPLRTVRS
ncbi:MAG: SPOR domain-containing protein [Alkalispirochaeta sp.]